MILNCVYPGCKSPAKWKPVIVIRMPDNHRPFEFDFHSTFICDKHKEILTLDDIIGGQVFPALINMFKKKFIHPPKKEHCSLRWDVAALPIFTSGRQIGHAPLIR